MGMDRDMQAAGVPPGGYGNPPGGYGNPPGGYGNPPGGYGNPPGGYGMPPQGPTPPGQLWNPGDPFTWAFAMMRADIQGIALPIVVAVVASALVSAIVSGGLSFAVGILSAAGMAGEMMKLMRTGTNVVGGAIGIVVGSYINAGLYAFLLNVARGRPVELADVFRGGRHFAKMLGATVLVGLATGLGTLLCIAPGVILALGLMMSMPLVVDRDLGAVDALKESWRLTDGHKMQLFVFMLIGIGIVILGALACCVGAWLVAQPLVMLAQAYVYLKLIGQEPVAAPGA